MINIPMVRKHISDLSPVGTQSRPSAAKPGHLEKNTSDRLKNRPFVLVWVYVAMVIDMTSFCQQNVKVVYRCTVF